MKYTSQDRERLLREREIELRLRQIEAEINSPSGTLRERVEPPLHQTVKNNNESKPTHSFGNDLKLAVKLSSFFIGSIVVVFASQIIAGMSFFIVIALAGWLCFELGKKFS